MPVAPTETFRVYAVSRLAVGRPDVVRLGISADRRDDATQGSFVRGMWGDDPVYVDTRAPKWQPQDAPAPWLGVAAGALLPQGRGTVYMPFEGRPIGLLLDEIAPQQTLPLNVALAIAKQMASALVWLHGQGRVHHGLCPEQVLLDDGQQVALLGLGHARPLSREHQEGIDRLRSAASLAYLAPEQTGRVGRPADARTDLYSLGAVLYRILTGRAPIGGEDRLALMHAIIAKPPAPAGVDPVVNRMLDRLLSKDAMHRYQTARGLLYDLERCCSALAAGDALPDMELGAADLADTLVLPDALYGRDPEVAGLFEAYDLADAATPTVVLVRGVAGSGKSRLIYELRRRADTLLWGKFDAADRGSPFAAVARAIDTAVTRLLSTTETHLNAQRDRVIEAVGGDMPALLPLVPRLGLLVGDVVAEDGFAPEAAQLRLMRALAALLVALTPTTQPVVLVIDDLQWADHSTFALLTALRSRIHRLLLIGAYREEEIGDDHPVVAFARETSARELTVGPIGADAVTWFVADALRTVPLRVAELGREVAQRTNGNPFFLRWFLRELHHRKALIRHADGGWLLESRAGEAVGVADNVATLLAGRLGELGSESLYLLQAAAVAGTWLQPALLGKALGWSDADVDAQLSATLDAEMVESVRGSEGQRYRFAHDRVREAALHSLDAGLRARLSVDLGRALWNEPDADPFDVANLLNGAGALLDDAERQRLCDVNIAAAERSLLGRGLDVAARLLDTAWTLLPESPWQGRYETALRCRNLQADVAFQRSDVGRAQACVEDVLANTKPGLDQAAALQLLQALLGAAGDVAGAMTAAYRNFDAMGEPMARLPSMAGLGWELARCMWSLHGRSKRELLTAAAMTDPRTLVVVRSVAAAAGTVESPLAVMVRALRSVRLTATHGPTKYAGFAYSTYGAMLCGPLGKLREGDDFGRLGMNIVRRFAAQDIENRVLTNYYAFVAHWTHPWRESVLGLERAVRSAQRAGDMTFLPGAMQFLTQIRLLSDGDLVTTLRDARAQIVELATDPHNQHRVQSHAAVLALLCEEPPKGDLLSGFAGQEHPEDQFTTAQFHVLRGIAAFLFDDLDQARKDFDTARPIGDALFCLPLVPAFKFYDAISALAAATDGDTATRRKAMAVAKRCRRYLAPRARIAPTTLGHRVALIDAELAACRGDSGDAALHFAEAIERAGRDGFPVDHAVALLRGADFHRAEGRTTLAEQHHDAALKVMHGCGADGWAAAPHLLRRAAQREEQSVNVDIDAIVRAGAAIGSELHLDRLLPRLTMLLQQNAGAQRVVLVTRHRAAGQTTWRIEAEAGPQGHRLLDVPLESGTDLLCLAAARYALRSHQVVRVDDATDAEEYRTDSYILKTGARSMLAIPMRSGGETSGLIYLENRLSAGTFDETRVRVVSLLAAQIGFALDNARLFAATASLKIASERFVPKQMLEVLGKRDIRDVALGDSVEGTMTVLFADIRRFTTLSEGMSPKETFGFINTYLKRMEPLIRRHGGFVDKYIGDAIMAVFPNKPDDAVAAAAHMLRHLAVYNAEREADGEPPIAVGIGMHTGPLMLGTVGGANRMEGTVIGDTVNLASRVESLTKTIGVPVLVTHTTVRSLSPETTLRFVSHGAHAVRGRSEHVELFGLVLKTV